MRGTKGCDLYKEAYLSIYGLNTRRLGCIGSDESL